MGSSPKKGYDVMLWVHGNGRWGRTWRKAHPLRNASLQHWGVFVHIHMYLDVCVHFASISSEGLERTLLNPCKRAGRLSDQASLNLAQPATHCPFDGTQPNTTLSYRKLHML